jgi:hypothetical protein
MPFKLEGNEVVNAKTGKSYGKSKNKKMAKKHLAAMYANVPEASKKKGGPVEMAKDKDMAKRRKKKYGY